MVDGIVLTKTAGELVDDGEVDVVLIEGLANGDEELVYGEDGGVEPETDLIFEGVEELENWFGQVFYMGLVEPVFVGGELSPEETLGGFDGAEDFSESFVFFFFCGFWIKGAEPINEKVF